MGKLPFVKDAGRVPVLALILIGLTLGSTAIAEPAGRWAQWGGPNRDFQAPAKGLASSWPEDGPKQLWSRELGDGYSSILVDEGRLYTMYRAEDKEAVIALDPKTGKTVWERRYDSAPRDEHVRQFGSGPRATPLLTGGRLYTIGVSGLMHCLKAEDGSVVWSQDLWGEELGGSFLNHGYSSSPVEYGDTVIVLVGGENASLVAFAKADGKVVWKGQSFKNSYSAPQILEVHGKAQLITYMADELVGVDPTSGELLWRYEITNQWQQNISMPVLLDGKYLFLSSLQAGARGLELVEKDGKIEPQELWTTRKIQFYHSNTVRQGDHVYGTTGTGGVYFLASVNARTGEIAWRKRGFAKANVLAADGKLVILDEDGKLYLATATPEDLVVHAEAQVLEKPAWTAPTIVGSTMYLRDLKTISAHDLS